jgi:putative nucleotidyltransferase with HDIG domain
MTAGTLDRVMEAVDTLPRLPQTTLKLVQVIHNPRSTIRQIVELIRYDQTMTTELLKLCNSAYVGLARKVASLDEAVRFLGTAKVLQLLVTAHSRTMLSKPQDGYGLPAGALWRHSVAVALAAQLVARRNTAPESGVLFTAGLLHDVGKVLLNEFVSREYAEIAARVQAEQVSFFEAERAALGVTHAEIGAAIAERWGLHADLVRCIRHHHEPGELPEPDMLVDIVHVADGIATTFGVGCGDDGLLYRADEAAVERCGLESLDIDALGAELVCELRSVEEMFRER